MQNHPTPGGATANGGVPKLAQMLSEQAENSTEGAFAQFRMSDDERYEFHLAAWLHDCGKITSPNT